MSRIRIKVDDNRINYLKEIQKNGSFVIEENILKDLKLTKMTKEIEGSIYSVLSFNRQFEITFFSIGIFSELDFLNPYIMEYMTIFFRFKDDPKLNCLYSLWWSIKNGESKRSYIEGKVF